MVFCLGTQSVIISIINLLKPNEEKLAKSNKKAKLSLAEIIINHIEKDKIDNYVKRVTLVGYLLNVDKEGFEYQKQQILKEDSLPYFFKTDNEELYNQIDIYLIDTFDSKHYIYFFQGTFELELPHYCLGFFELTKRPNTKQLSNEHHYQFENENDFILYDYQQDGDIEDHKSSIRKFMDFFWKVLFD